VTGSRIPPPLARRIDRLARRAHAFHRFAHHPLCHVYRGEVVRVGRRFRLCKGCTFLTAGLAAGIVGGAFVRLPLAWGTCALLLALVLGTLSLRLRLPKIAGRLLPGVGLGLALWAGWPCVLASLLVVVLVGALYRRRGVDRSRCATCPERSLSPCSGFASIVRRERAFRRRADGWLEALPNGPASRSSSAAPSRQ
jgi:lysylphosphatidylglycerol synthetase-like protein (DUF2156 family)